MIELYFLQTSLLQILLISYLLLVAVQAIYISLISFSVVQKQLGELGVEITLLFYIAILAKIPSSIITNLKNSVVHIDVYRDLLYICAIPLTLCFILFLVIRKKIYFGILCIVFTLPVISKIGFGSYTLFYVLFLIVFLIRTVFLIKQKLDNRRNIITSVSVRQGLNTLSAGIMFFDNDGYIYLVNEVMSSLMFHFFDKEFRNGNALWQSIQNNTTHTVKVYNKKNQITLRSPNSTWQFSLKSFTLSNKHYSELIAIDISETDKNLLELKKKERDLLSQERKIKKLAEKMIMLRQEKEYASLQAQVHEVMGQRLTAMQRMLHTKVSKSYDTIISLIKDMLLDIKGEYKASFHQSFFELRNYFEKKGITITLTGNIPKNNTIIYLFLSIIEEATLNAIRHAEARFINVDILLKNQEWHINITNDGKKPKKNIVEKKGLSDIRKRVENLGGTMYIISKPLCNISVKISEDSHD